MDNIYKVLLQSAEWYIGKPLLENDQTKKKNYLIAQSESIHTRRYLQMNMAIEQKKKKHSFIQNK